MTEKQFFELRLKSQGTAQVGYGRFKGYLAENYFRADKTKNDDRPYCRIRLMTGKFCPGGCNYPFRGESLHPSCPDQDHDRWFVDAAGRFVYTIQPYVADLTPGAMEKCIARLTREHEEFARKEGLAVRISMDQSWWNPNETVLIEYRAPRWWERTDA